MTRYTRLIVLLMAAAVIGCAAHVLPPALLIESGVKTDFMGLRKEEITSFSTPAGKRLTRVMQLGWDETTGQLRVVTEFGRDMRVPTPPARSSDSCGRRGIRRPAPSCRPTTTRRWKWRS